MSAYAHIMFRTGGLVDQGESSDVLTVEEAADLSGLSQQTIRRRCITGEIKANKVGKQWLIHSRDFGAGKQGRKRASPPSASFNIDYSRALIHIQRTDLSELWVPDVLRLQDHFADGSTVIAEAEQRIARSSFGTSARILVPKTIYSNRPGTSLDLADRIAYQGVVASIGQLLDQKLPDNVYSSRLSSDAKYFLAHSSKAYRRFKQAIPDSIKDDPALEWIGSTDITAYFDNILHSILFEELSHAGASGESLKALRVMLSEWTPVSGLGLPQGPNASRLLGNFYLGPVDEEMSDDPAIVYLRYMDDVRILARRKVDAVAALRKFENLCRSRGLALSSAKTFVETVHEYRLKDLDGRLDKVASMFDKNAITKSRPELKKMLKQSLGENSINVRHAKFSIWRLAKIREIGVLSRVLAKLELLAPVASPTAAYLKHFINRPHVQRRITEFMEDETRSYSDFLRSWIYAAMLEVKIVPSDWRRIAEIDVKDKNRPTFLRGVAACVLGKAAVPRDLAWLKSEAKIELDPEMARAYLVALAYGGSLDKGLTRTIAAKHPSTEHTSNWLKGRVGLPSLLYPRQHIRTA